MGRRPGVWPGRFGWIVSRGSGLELIPASPDASDRECSRTMSCTPPCSRRFRSPGPVPRAWQPRIARETSPRERRASSHGAPPFVEFLLREIPAFLAFDALAKLDDILLHSAQFVGAPLEELRLLIPSRGVRPPRRVRRALRPHRPQRAPGRLRRGRLRGCRHRPAAVGEHDGALADFGHPLNRELSCSSIRRRRSSDRSPDSAIVCSNLTCACQRGKLARFPFGKTALVGGSRRCEAAGAEIVVIGEFAGQLGQVPVQADAGMATINLGQQRTGGGRAASRGFARRLESSVRCCSPFSVAMGSLRMPAASG